MKMISLVKSLFERKPGIDEAERQRLHDDLEEAKHLIREYRLRNEGAIPADLWRQNERALAALGDFYAEFYAAQGGPAVFGVWPNEIA